MQRRECVENVVDGARALGAVSALMVCLLAVTLSGCASSGSGDGARANRAKQQGAAFDRDDAEREPGLLMRMLGRGQPTAPPEPTPLEEGRRRRPKPLTVPQDTVNALRLMAQDWLLEAKTYGTRIRETGSGEFLREYDAFGDKYTLEIERADEDDDATLIGYVFVNSSHFQTAAHPVRTAAEADTDYREQPRKLRMTFRLLERWEFSALAEEFVFNRVWELARIQFKPAAARTRTPAAPAVPAVTAPQATPRK